MTMLPSVINNSVGLSVLIPIFNFDVTSLVQSLAVQLEKSGNDGEIILLNDGSTDEMVNANQALQNIPSVKFFKNEINEGRMLARQKLSSFARFEYFLFLDCDSEIIKDDFLEKYFELVNRNIPLATGGRVYTDAPPSDCTYMLHWKYGSKRESRQHKPGTTFQSNNFLIKKEVFKLLNTSLKLTGYGHEDSWWGIQFEQAGISCYYLNNPVLHTNIEIGETYLKKSEQALANLLFLEIYIDNKLLSKHIRIYKWYRRIKSSGMFWLFLLAEKLFHDYFRRNLLSCKPNLFYFDCFRLAILLRLAKNK